MMQTRGSTTPDALSPLLNQKLGDMKAELGEAMRLMMDIENKSAIGGSRTPSPMMTPKRSRSNTPTPRKVTSAFGDLGQDASLTMASRSGTGVKERILTSYVPKSAGGIRGPQILDLQTVEYPMGDFIPNDPLGDYVMA
jgi:hypothetical protein